ncbi:MAG TPA: hypothetical protein VGD67_12855, partial [Pseudonocardiaceae bacterium]
MSWSGSADDRSGGRRKKSRRGPRWVTDHAIEIARQQQRPLRGFQAPPRQERPEPRTRRYDDHPDDRYDRGYDDRHDDRYEEPRGRGGYDEGYDRREPRTRRWVPSRHPGPARDDRHVGYSDRYDDHDPDDRYEYDDRGYDDRYDRDNRHAGRRGGRYDDRDDPPTVPRRAGGRDGGRGR